MRTPAALIAVPLLAGSVLGLTLSDGTFAAFPLCAAAACWLALVAAASCLGDAEGLAAATVVGSLAAGVSLGTTAAVGVYHPPLLAWFEARTASERDAPVWLEGKLRDDASITPFGTALTIDAVLPARGGVRVSIGGSGRDDAAAWRAGRGVRCPALLRRPTAYGNPGLPDDTRALARRGIVLVGSIKSASLVAVEARGGAIDEAAASGRAWSRQQIGRYIGRWSAQSGAIAAAILIGDRTGLSDEDERRLQESGTYHVIAISGGNIAILTAILLALLRLPPLGPRLSSAAVIVALLFYGQVASGGASVSRAVTAASIYLGGRVLDHRGPPLNALAVAAALSLTASPVTALDGGFILSFGATLGILLGAPRLWRRVTPALTFRHAAALRPALGLLIATVCAEIALTPVTATLFSRVTVAGLFLNFAAIPLMTVTQAAAMATLALAVISARAAEVCGFVAHLGAAALVRSAGLIDYARWLSHDVVPPAWWLICVYYASCLWLLTARHARIALSALACAGVLMFTAPPTVTRSPIAPPQAGDLRVAFFDVGEGDAALIILPDGRSFLVDTGGIAGGGFDVGDRIVGPELLMFGVRRLDTLVLTHGDFDHIGGAPAILRRFGPHVVWEGIPVPPHIALREVAEQAAAAGISWRNVVTGDRERTGSVEIRVLHPPLPDWERQRVRNDDSIVLELRYGAASIVLPGDVGREGEQALSALLTRVPIRVLKAPHHGSASSSTPPLLDAASPTAVVFSAGRANRFGHPAPVILDRYRDRRALIFRTDEDGAIVLDTDGSRVRFSTWSGRRGEINQQPTLTR
jgi:competence protein ComEC